MEIRGDGPAWAWVVVAAGGVLPGMLGAPLGLVAAGGVLLALGCAASVAVSVARVLR